MDLDRFAEQHAPNDSADQFDLENEKLLDIAVDGSVMTKAGSMVAYDGDLSFTGKSSAEGGLKGVVKSKLTSEGTPIMQAEGSGHLYVADQGKNIQVLDLDAGEELSVNGEDILAFESRVDYSIGMIDSLSGVSTGGLTNVFLEGPGKVAITTHGHPVVLEPPVRTDPDATVAWSTTSPSSNVDRNLKNMVGQSSGESFQLDFTGSEGFVVVQPFEESGAPQQTTGEGGSGGGESPGLGDLIGGI
ncbi:MAG: AIM24 family protein [Halococcoides sp.]